MSREAMKQALEALEHIHRTGDTQVFDLCYAKEVIPALRAALDAPEPDYERGFVDGMQEQMKRSVDQAVNAMCKREWVGLTEEERESIWIADQMTQEEWDTLFDTIEAKLKEKNT